MNSARNLQRLNAIQSTRGLTNHQVGEIIGRSAQTVGAYRCGARNVPDDAVAKLECWNEENRAGLAPRK